METSFNRSHSSTNPSHGDGDGEIPLSYPSHLALTPQQISDLEEQWRENRTKITLFQQPRKTLLLFFAAAFNVLKNTLSYLISHPMLLKFLLPLVSLWYFLEFIPGFYTDTINDIEFWIQYVVWWIGLGILSSIGLGSGLQTGVLFLFPHIMRVCITAQSCRSTNFKSFGAIWFNSAETHHLFKCLQEPSPDQPLPSYLSVWFLVLIPSFLQSTGTAIGEIPPYWLTRAARQAAIDAGEKSDVPEELEATSQYNLINRLKGRMISFLRSHGFLGVFLMASWPNFAFDLCGICCGHFLMPFWTFFGATFLGKACVRNTYQTLLLVALLSLHTVVEVYLREALDEMKNSAHGQHPHTSGAASGGSEDGSGGSYLSAIWTGLMTAVLSFFLLSCVNQFAQLYQALIDKDLIEDLKLQLPPLIRKELTCPATGKIILPPPTSASPQLQAHLQETSSAPFGSSNSLLSLSSDAPASASGLATAATPPRCPSGANANASPLSLASHHLSDTVLLRQIHPPSSPTHSSTSSSPSPSASSSSRRPSSFSTGAFHTPPKSRSRSGSRSEYSPGNAFVLAVIDGNRDRDRNRNSNSHVSLNRLSLSPQPSPHGSSSWSSFGFGSSVGLTNRKESNTATAVASTGSGSGSVPLVVRRTNLFNFSTGAMESSSLSNNSANSSGLPSASSIATTSGTDNGNKRCD